MNDRIQRRRSRRQAEEAPAVSSTAQAQAQAVDLDAILAEIDEVLETDAEEYVRNFVQKGGQ